ncbi:4462_t:CDS:1 [Paraglomus brasilianum]|uniref:4462_t:CDS:1 n=1 Tax=Paraglomus brasilianum TaxID=144538 RepID=A0A9N8ZPW7_9GLOM|nr:4462_t:CDS:1 [Paraglomus brasilianum]
MHDKLEIPITKIQWSLRGAQIFFAFFAMCTIAAVISFDNSHTSSSIMANFDLFIILVSMPTAAAIVVIPHLYLKYGKFKTFAKAMRHPRYEFVLSTIWAALLLICSIGLSVEFGVIRDCNPEDYPEALNKSGDSFRNGLLKSCTTGKASTAFGWFALAAWLGSLGLLANDWRNNRRQPATKNESGWFAWLGSCCGSRRQPVAKNESGFDDIMHSNSTRSSLEDGTVGYQDKERFQSITAIGGSDTPPVSEYNKDYNSPPIHLSPPLAPTPQPIPAPQPASSPLQIQPPPGAVSFPEPQRF